MITKKSELNTNTEDIIEIENNREEAWKDGSYKGIIKATTWPSFGKAIKYTTYSLISSVVIGTILYFYSYGINQLIALFT